ncbi:MAG TPA: PEP-CTERM sorting domain-containing protein [Pyrinomonadaceae bacterium]
MLRLASPLKPLVTGFALLAFIAAAQTVARADQVTFLTTSCFGVGCTPTAPATAVSSTGAPFLTFIGQQATTVDTGTPSGFTAVDLGTFLITTSPLGGGTFGPTPFVLRITQSAPSAGTGTFTSTLTGTVVINGSDVRVIFDQTSLLIANVRYDLANLTFGNTLFLDPNATGGVTRLSALVSSPVPEPATLILLGTGLAGAAGAARRRRARP